jgi:phosphate transport system permease protein
MSNRIPDKSSFDLPTRGLTRSYSSGRSLFGIVMTILAGACLVIALIPLFAVLIYVIGQGLGRLDGDLFTKLPPAPGLKGGGIANAILGTFITVGIGTLISVPFGVLAAVYLSEFSSGKISQWIRFATNVLAGVPSIIAGIFSFGLIVATTGKFSAVAGGVALAVLMLPTIIRTTDEALKIVPQDIRWASVGVGASNYQTVLQIVVPAAIPAIITGVTLAIARAAGETAPLIFTALNSPFWPKLSPQALWNQPIASLSVLIYNFATVPFKAQQELAWAASLILVFMILLTSILARFATRRKLY